MGRCLCALHQAAGLRPLACLFVKEVFTSLARGGTRERTNGCYAIKTFKGTRSPTARCRGIQELWTAYVVDGQP